ncbi:MAG: FtsW/RodA/SpoVE family cell cycle protein [Planctomycetota bacterium]|jgi:cell division protein FtsW
MSRTALRSEAIPRQRELDWLMAAVLCLCCLGLVMAVSVQAFQPGGTARGALQEQSFKLLAGLAAFLVCALMPLGVIKRYSWGLFFVGAGLVYGAALFGPAWNGARRWVSIANYSFQPVDLAKLALIIITAALIARSGQRIKEFREGFLAVLIPGAVMACGLAFQPDLGNALICLTLVVCMSLVAGVAIRWFTLGMLLCSPLLVAAVIFRGYAVGRITAFLSSEPPYQVAQSLTAMSSGGLTGQGLGAGWMKMGFVPEAHNDFVFAVIGEELGFIGLVLVLGLYSLIGYVGLRLVLQIRDPFCRFLVLGCTVAVCIQALINMLVTTGMVPAKGIDLPMVSSGGTNLMSSLAAIGLIGNAARTDRLTW